MTLLRTGTGRHNASSLQLTENWLNKISTQVWDLDLQRHEGNVKDIILVAQGEIVLEEFLMQVKET